MKRHSDDFVLRWVKEARHSEKKKKSAISIVARAQNTGNIKHYNARALSATQQQQHSLVTATAGASVCMYVCFCTCSVCCHMHTNEDERFFFARAADQPRSHKISIQQYSSNDTTAEEHQAFAFVPVVMVYVCG